MGMKSYLLLLLGVFVSAVVVSRLLPWWGAVTLIPITILGFFFLTIWLMKRLWRKNVIKGLRIVGQVLHNANVEIHSVALTTPPREILEIDKNNNAASELDEDSDKEDWDDYQIDRYCTVDMTVTPDPTALAGYANVTAVEKPDETWNPVHFDLVSFDSFFDQENPSLKEMYANQASSRMIEYLDDNGQVLHSNMADADADEWDDDQVGEDCHGNSGDNKETSGSMRVRILFSIPRNLPERVKLRYSLNEFGNITLPQGTFNPLTEGN